jgi:hypothetical protein
MYGTIRIGEVSRLVAAPGSAAGRDELKFIFI